MRVLILLAILATSAAAQRPADLPVMAEERDEIIAAVADRIERYYADAQKGAEIAAVLRTSRFDEETALALVPAVNRVLKAAGGDQHLRFGYTDEPQAVTDGDDEGTPEEQAAHRLEVAKNGFGIHGVQRLDGNVGVLTWARFHEPELAGDSVAAAMKLLDPTDALIIDLRNSDGGSPDMVLLLLSYFLPEGDPVLASTVYNRYRDTTEQRWTLPYVPGRRYVRKPVYILTSKRTWSAGEGFTEHMRRLAKATVVGETTKGGARMSRWMTIHPHFAVSVPVARHTGDAKDWEGVGIIPDVAVPETEAFQTAYALALKKLVP